MADWFETRFREPVEVGRLDPGFAARVRALVRDEWQAGAGSTQPVDADVGDYEGDLIMLETQDHPTTGPGSRSPRRRLPGGWLAVAAAAALVAIVGALLVGAAGNDDRDEVDTASSVSQAPAPKDAKEFTESEMEPGTYFIDPDQDPSTPLRVTFEVAAEGWNGWTGASKEVGLGRLTLSIMTVTNLVTDGCTDFSPADPAVGPTVDDLATALTQLAPFQVTSPPSDVTILGYHGKHVALLLPDLPMTGAGGGRRFAECTDGQLHSWIAPFLGASYWGYTGPLSTEDFWILDVDGTRLVIAINESPDMAPEDNAELQAIFDSIRIEP